MFPSNIHCITANYNVALLELLCEWGGGEAAEAAVRACVFHNYMSGFPCLMETCPVLHIFQAHCLMVICPVQHKFHFSLFDGDVPCPI